VSILITVGVMLRSKLNFHRDADYLLFQALKLIRFVTYFSALDSIEVLCVVYYLILSRYATSRKIASSSSETIAIFSIYLILPAAP
jgi:hypothetical protein